MVAEQALEGLCVPARHSDREDLRQRGPDALGLAGVVVQEDEGVEAEVQLRGQAPEARGLRAPMHLPRRKLRAAQLHAAGPLVKDAEHVGLVVARGQAHQAPLHLQLGDLFLQHAMGTTHVEIFDAVLSNHATPQSLIAIADEHFELARQVPCHCTTNGDRHERRGASCTPSRPAARVVGRQRRPTHHIDVLSPSIFDTRTQSNPSIIGLLVIARDDEQWTSQRCQTNDEVVRRRLQ
mmetsp:Transcript_155943/g.499974  ORF Transcript_155943/g.499974 Transcript_155943/m.499974 type:complete len:237 (-) Transcript_155943:727-1437(-)